MCPGLEDLKTITDASPLKYVPSTEKVCNLIMWERVQRVFTML